MWKLQVAVRFCKAIMNKFCSIWYFAYETLQSFAHLLNRKRETGRGRGRKRVWLNNTCHKRFIKKKISDRSYILIFVSPFSFILNNFLFWKSNGLQLYFYSMRQFFSCCHNDQVVIKLKKLEMLFQQILEPEVVGHYDAIVVHADNGAVDFFQKFGFSDDIVLNSRWR